MAQKARYRLRVNLAAVRRNIREVRKHIGNERLLTAVIKKNAYGHGLVPIAECCLESGVDRLAVADTSEAAVLREAGVKAEIHLLGPLLREEVSDCVRLGLIPALTDEQQIEWLSSECRRVETSVKAHMLVDTGMGRLGPLAENALELAEKATKAEGLELEGVFTHFPRPEDPQTCADQLQRFLALLEEMESRGIKPPLRHIAGCGVVFRMPEAHLDMVRVGLCIFGVYNYAGMKNDVDLHPAMSISSEVLFVKEVPPGTPVSYGATFVTRRRTRLATVPVGYGHGYPVTLSNRGWVGINGRKAPVVGRVTMDYFMVDVTDIPGVERGTPVWIMGKGGPSAEELAEAACTITHDIVITFGQHSPVQPEYVEEEV